MKYVIQSGAKIKNKKTGVEKVYWSYFKDNTGGWLTHMTNKIEEAKTYVSESLARIDAKKYCGKRVKITKVK